MGFFRKFAFFPLRVWLLLVRPRLFAIPKPPRNSTRGMDRCLWSFLADSSSQLWAIFILEILARAKTKGAVAGQAAHLPKATTRVDAPVLDLLAVGPLVGDAGRPLRLSRTLSLEALQAQGREGRVHCRVTLYFLHSTSRLCKD